MIQLGRCGGEDELDMHQAMKLVDRATKMVMAETGVDEKQPP